MEHLLERLKDDIQIRGLSLNTENEYTDRARVFLKWCNKSEEDLSDHDIRDFLQHLIKDTQYKSGSINNYNSALRFFFGVTLDKAVNYKRIPRMKHRRAFPDILTKPEIRHLLDNCQNLRDKAFFMLAYGSGLRISEVVSLKVSHIDSSTMRVFIECGKGKKDRFTVLSQECLETLRIYWKACRPKYWLFPSRNNKGENHISKRQAQHILQKYTPFFPANKHITVHTFRQAFATHLFEDGVSAVDIKNLLGHVNIQTTTFYLNLADVRSGIKSPLDSLSKKKKRKAKVITGDINA